MPLDEWQSCLQSSISNALCAPWVNAQSFSHYRGIIYFIFTANYPSNNCKMKHKYLRQSVEMASLCAYNYTQCNTNCATLALRIEDGECARRDLMSNILSRARCMQLTLGISLLCCFVHTAQTNTRTHVHYNWLTVIILMDNRPSRLTHAAAEWATSCEAFKWRWIILILGDATARFAFI